MKNFLKRCLLRLYNGLINHAYILDNPINQQRIKYLQKVVADPEYLPSTPLEHYIENKIMTIWIEQDPEKRSEDLWNVIRPLYFQQIIEYIDQFPRYKDF